MHLDEDQKGYLSFENVVQALSLNKIFYWFIRTLILFILDWYLLIDIYELKLIMWVSCYIIKLHLKSNLKLKFKYDQKTFAIRLIPFDLNIAITFDWFKTFG